MNEDNFNAQNIEPENTEPQNETPVMTEEPQAEAPKKKTGLFVGVSSSFLIILTIVISVLVTTWMQRSDNGDGGGATTDDDDTPAIVIDDDAEVLGIDDLSAGTVKTTIGGKTVSYKAKYVVDGVTAVIESGTYESTDDDEVVFLVINGGTLSLENVEINKSGSETFNGRGDNYSFYGTNSAIVVAGEDSQAGLTDTTINTSVDGANAVVATDSGSVIVSNIIINTTKDSSRGLHATFGGKIIGNEGTIATAGQSCAALATDRGEGTVKVSGMKLSTEGAGSPLIYSTGNIEVSSSTGTASGAQIAVVEGKNSITLNDCDFSANGNGNRGQVDNAAVMIYQSMSGDAAEGAGSFRATDTKMTVLSSSSVYETTPLFFVTNTTANIELENVKASFYEDGYFILAAGTTEWGKSGKNGGIVTIDAVNLEATNTEVGVDEISKVNGL
ncbi:hypothetical protein IJU85_03260 [Candidatus Saccharibacteria bacterium]|nr:hypothetical protein [Candidatus Saccharibacteria bacterium]